MVRARILTFKNFILSQGYIFDISSYGLNGRVKEIYYDPYIIGFTGLMVYQSEYNINFLGFATGIV